MTLRFLTHSHCIWDLDLRCKLEAAMSGRASLLEAKLMIPGTEMTFLEFSADQELCYCWVCARCAQTPKENGEQIIWHDMQARSSTLQPCKSLASCQRMMLHHWRLQTWINF